MQKIQLKRIGKWTNSTCDATQSLLGNVYPKVYYTLKKTESMRSILGHLIYLVYFDYNAGYGIRTVTCMWDLQDSHPRQSEQGGHSGHWEEAIDIATRICKTKGAPAPKVLQLRAEMQIVRLVQKG